MTTSTSAATAPTRPPIWEVQIHKRVASRGRAFELDVQFSSSANRTVIYGPSGAGKSLTLQALAGLLRPDRGVIRFRGETLFDGASGEHQLPRARRVGYLFQDYALFPHLSVRQNIAFGLQTGWINPLTRARQPEVERWLDALELREVADLRPVDLSGGQRQRTALARALVHQPRALLLDEPFSALDPALRARMRDELDALLTRLNLPMVMITHDPEDLARFGESRWQISQGRILPVPPHPPVHPHLRVVTLDGERA